MSNKIVIANMMRCRNKQSFFALHQIQTEIHKVNPNIDIEFHILWDSDPYKLENQDNPYYTNLIETYIRNLHSYDRKFFKEYASKVYRVENVQRFDDWAAIYLVLLSHYLRRAKLYDYFLIYDDDILINDSFELVTNLLQDHVPVLITEPMNVNCDKVLLKKLVEVYGMEFYERYINRNPKTHGFNAGFQGIDLSIYDDFLSVDRFSQLIDMFNIQSIFDANNKEIWGPERFKLDTQQQSFFSLMNVVLGRKEPHILDTDTYFVVPNWGHHPIYGEIDIEDDLNGWGICLKSKISHFIGHTHGKGKPKVFLDRVDEYLKTNGFTI